MVISTLLPIQVGGVRVVACVFRLLRSARGSGRNHLHGSTALGAADGELHGSSDTEDQKFGAEARSAADKFVSGDDGQAERKRIANMDRLQQTSRSASRAGDFGAEIARS